MRRRRAAFTLMEMLLVTTLIAVISVAVFQAFNNGLKLWARGVRLDNQGNTSIMLDKMGEDLRRAVLVTAIPFNGLSMRFSFPAVISAQADKNGSRAGEGLIEQLGAVEYRYEPAEGKIFRRQALYGQALKGQWGGDMEVASGLENVLFQYYFPGKKGFALSAQADGVLPEGVSIAIRFKGEPTDHELKRSFAIMVGG